MPAGKSYEETCPRYLFAPLVGLLAVGARVFRGGDLHPVHRADEAVAGAIRNRTC